MKKQIRKPISILLSLVLVLTLAFCSVLPAFAEGEEENWVLIKTSSDPTLSEGDYYVDLSSVKDVFTERYAW